MTNIWGNFIYLHIKSDVLVMGKCFQFMSRTHINEKKLKSMVMMLYLFCQTVFLIRFFGNIISKFAIFFYSVLESLILKEGCMILYLDHIISLNLDILINVDSI